MLVPYTLHVTRISPYKHWSCHVIWFYCCSYTGISNQHNVSPSLFDISRQFEVRYNPLLVPYTLHVARISPNKHWSCHVVWFCCCSYTGIRNQHNVSPSLFDISTQFRRYLTYLGNSMCLIIPSRWHKHCTSLGFIHINTGPFMSYDFNIVHIQV
jgi:hypothetical protein